MDLGGNIDNIQLKLAKIEIQVIETDYFALDCNDHIFNVNIYIWLNRYFIEFHPHGIIWPHYLLTLSVLKITVSPQFWLA